MGSSARVPRDQGEMVQQLRRHMRLLQSYYEKAFLEGDADYFGELAGKLRLLTARFRSNEPLLLRLIEETGADVLVTLGGPPVERPPGQRPGDKISLHDFLQLEAVGVQVPSRGFVMLTKAQMIKAWAEQTGSSHEDWSMEEPLHTVLATPIYIGGLLPAAAELRVTTEAVIHVGKRFLALVDAGDVKI